MRIRKIHIDNFGKFKDYSIDLSDGLNIIYGQNEAGKSTLMTFISMLFYGSKQRSQDLLKSPRDKYKPWDNSPMSGHIILDSDLGQIRVQRQFGKTNKKDQVEVFNNITGQHIPINDYEQPGKDIFHMDLEEFEKTIFIDSDSISLKGNNHKIQDKLTQTFTNQDSGSSAKEAILILEKKLFSLKSRRGDKGQIIDLENKLENLEKDIRLAESLEEERISLEEELSYLDQAKNIEKKKDYIDRIKESKERAKNLNEANLDRKNIEKKIKVFEEDLLKTKAYVKSDEIRLSDQEDLLNQDKKEKVKIESSINDLEKEIIAYSKGLNDINGQKFNIPYIMGGLISLSLLILGYFITNQIIKYIGIALGLFILVIYLLGYKNKSAKIMQMTDYFERSKSNLNELRQEALAIDKSIHETKSHISSLNSSIDKNKLYIIDLEYKIEEAREYRKKLSSRGIFQSLDPRIFEKEDLKLKNLEQEYLNEKSNFESKNGPYSKYIGSSEESAYIQLMKRLEERKAYGKERFKGAINLDQAKYLYEKSKAELKEKYQEYKVLSLAIEGIDRAKTKIANDFTPLLNQKSQEILSKITSGKYRDLIIAQDFSVKVLDSQINQFKDFEYFSSGTRDQIFLAIRIGLAKILNRNQNPILILDDVLVKFDETRSIETIKTLDSLRDNFQQVIMFTCNKHHVSLADDKVNKIYL